jgi:ferredoxin-thioredoxin reductase catalytic subunit
MTLDELLLAVMQRVGTFSLVVEEKPHGAMLCTCRFYSEKHKFAKEVISASVEKTLAMVLELTQTGL